VIDKDDFRRKVAATTPGTQILLKGIRNGKPITFNVVVGERPSRSEARVHPDAEEPSKNPSPPRMGRAGISVQELSDQHRRMYRSDVASGVVIVEVDPISPAADAGLAVGEVILEINKHRVTSLLQYQKLIAGFKANDPLMLLVAKSRDSMRIVTLKLEPIQ
jgi:serine protease Do